MHDHRPPVIDYAAEVTRPAEPAPTRERARFLFIAGFAIGFVIGVMMAPAHAAEVTLSDGAPATSSQLRDLSAGFGPRASDWTRNVPAPGAVNSAGHEGRDAGTFEDRGFGGISGQVHAGADGIARIAVQDLADTETGVLKIKTGGEWHRVEVSRGENGNWRSLSWRAAQGWHDFKAVWHGDRTSGKGTAQDGYSVKGGCR